MITPDIIPAIPATDRIYRVAPDTITVIGRDTEDGQEHELWDERAFLPDNEEQILSFMAIGVQVPLRVRRGPTGRTEVVEGRRRTIEGREACRRLLAMGEAPILLPIVFSSARLSPEMLLLLGVELNERRVQDPPAVKARKAKRMLDRGITLPTVARAFGVTRRSIEDWIKAMEAPANVHAAVELGIINSSTAVELARAPDPEAALETLIAEPKPGRVRAAAIAREQRAGVAAGSSSTKMPHGAVRRVLAAHPGIFSDDFLRGIRFAKGELSAKEVEKILKHAAKEKP